MNRSCACYNPAGDKRHPFERQGLTEMADATAPDSGPPVPVYPDKLVASPCVSVCTVDAERGWCIGCLRTLAEIGAWRTMTLEQKRATVAACAERARTVPPRDQ